MLAPRPTPKLEDHPSSAVRACLFNLLVLGPKNIRNHRKIFSHPGDLAFGICAPLTYMDADFRVRFITEYYAK
jgi:hypothetical protein